MATLRALTFILALFFAVTNPFAAEPQWDLKRLSAAPGYKWLDNKSPIRSLTYKGGNYNGQPTDVFAFYATPNTISRGKNKTGKFPGIVLIHGGGGTAFAEWVEIWAKRGYAAIAMDLSGHRPEAPIFNAKTGELKIARGRNANKRTRLEHGGPAQGHQQKFASIGGDTSDDWPYHAVASCILAHSLIRSFPEVDAERTAVTGISWGGYTTCITASVDPRFKAAVPVYGCGFLHEGESVQKPSIDALEPERRAEWIRRYDPSSHLGKCTVPIFFVNGTHDKHYPLNSYMKSYALPRGPKLLRIEPRMAHSHPAGWRPAEIGEFIDSKINSGRALLKFGKPTRHGNRATVSVTGDLPIKSATLHYTAESGLLTSRKWSSAPAKIRTGGVSAEALPDNATIWFFTADDEAGRMTSSETIFGPAKQK